MLSVNILEVAPAFSHGRTFSKTRVPLHFLVARKRISGLLRLPSFPQETSTTLGPWVVTSVLGTNVFGTKCCRCFSSDRSRNGGEGGSFPHERNQGGGCESVLHIRD